MKKECKTFERKVVLLLDNDPAAQRLISRAKRKILEEHLFNCKTCQKTKEDVERIIKAFKTFPRVKAPKDLINRVVNRIQQL